MKSKTVQLVATAAIFLGFLFLWTPDGTYRRFDSEISEMGRTEPRPVALTAEQDAFLAMYRATSTRAEKRGLIERYLPVLRAEGLLDALEAKFPLCHSQAHEVGESLFEASHDFRSTLSACGTRCSTGCFHGLLIGALKRFAPEERNRLAHPTLETVAAHAQEICRDSQTLLFHREGNCIHGIGHAFTILSNYVLRDAVGACRAFDDPRLQYYCATGAFMEYLHNPPGAPTTVSLDEPCAAYPEFPAACYRYNVARFLSAKNRSPSDVEDECLGREGLFRLGCFHGIGYANTRNIYEKPFLLGSVCKKGGIEDRIACLDAPIELIAQFDRDRALEACETLPKDTQPACREAAERSIYSLRENFAYYIAGR